MGCENIYARLKREAGWSLVIVLLYTLNDLFSFSFLFSFVLKMIYETNNVDVLKYCALYAYSKNRLINSIQSDYGE